MNYVFSLSNGSDYHTGDIIHVRFHDGRGIRTRTDAATSPSIAKYSASTYYATETSPKKEAQIAQIKITAFTGPYRGSNVYYSLVFFHELCVFPQ